MIIEIQCNFVLFDTLRDINWTTNNTLVMYTGPNTNPLLNVYRVRDRLPNTDEMLVFTSRFCEASLFTTDSSSSLAKLYRTYNALRPNSLGGKLHRQGTVFLATLTHVLTWICWNWNNYNLVVFRPILLGKRTKSPNYTRVWQKNGKPSSASTFA